MVIRLVNSLNGEPFGIELYAPQIPFGERIEVSLPGDVVWEFYIDTPDKWAFYDDGRAGEAWLGHVDLAVRETAESRARRLGVGPTRD